ncbi:MAG TPA: hypothetical protein VFR23_11310 [Jiangellaceae bacterium]|nr:hypothetical protein [Jiangellaceae bacterium]
MSDATKRMIQPTSAPAWFAAAAAAAAIGLILSATANQLPDAAPLTVEDAVDAAGQVALGGLGVVLVRRGIAAGLGRALLLLAVLAGSMWLCGGLADAITDGSPPPVTAQLLTLTSTVLFPPVFVLLFVAPLLLFPTGQLPSPRWRWVVAAAMSGTVAAMISLLLAPGLLDDDVPAWGDNPLGVAALEGPTSTLEAVGLVLVLVSIPASLAAVAVRIVRYHGARRTQMWWFVAGITPMVAGLATDAGESQLAEVVSALVIFGGLLGGISWALLGAPGRRIAQQALQTTERSQARTGTNAET